MSLLWDAVHAPMINILIADDHAIFIEALVAMLHGSDECCVVATATSGFGVLEILAARSDIDVLVLDISMPQLDGIATLAELRRLKIAIPTLMLTQEISGGTIVRAMKAGASGYVLKTAGRSEFIAAIRAIAAGGEYISDAAKEILIARLTGRRNQSETLHLTRRELEVLKLIAEGKTTGEIAELLVISVYTVETHRRNLLQKLNLRNAAALTRYAIEHGLTDE